MDSEIKTARPDGAPKAHSRKLEERANFYAFNRQLDFLEYIFDKHIDYMTQSEMWEEFEKWEDLQP